MTKSGRCYCGEITFEFDYPIHSQILCHCRECRYISGGEPNASIIIEEDKFRLTKGILKTFSRDDLDKPRIRFFCSNCGTAICSKLTSRTVWKAGLFSHLKDIEVAVNVWSSSANKLCKVDTDKKSFDHGR